MSDLNGGFDYINNADMTGANVLYGNGAVKRVPLGRFKNYVSGGEPYTTPTLPFTEEWLFSMWAVFDLN